MTGAQVLGAVIVAAFFAYLFAATALMDGWLFALAIWAFAIGATGVLILGVFLLVGGA